ncbi:hypothetical protein Q7P36_008967 [Cladosporium allicinum]
MPRDCHAANAWDGCFTAAFVVVNNHVLVRLVKKSKSLFQLDEMMRPQASASEKKVISKYWADECQATPFLRGKSVPTLGNKRAAPECGDSTGLEAERLRRKHARTFDFKPAHPDEVEVKDEPISTQPPSDPPLPLAERPQSDAVQSTTDISAPTEPLPPTVTPPVRLPSTTVPAKPLPPSPPFRLSPSTFPARSSSPIVVVKPACKPPNSESSIWRQKPHARPRSPCEEDAVIATLAHICDESVIVATINLVLRWGREAPNPSGESDDLGISYLKGIVARIDKLGIAPDRRVVIIGLLCSRYMQHLEDLKSRIGTLSAPQLPLSPPSSVDRPVDPQANVQEIDQRILTASVEAIYADHDAQTSQAKSLASATTATSAKAILPKQPFDVFQEAALAARNFTTEEKSELPEFQKHIKSVWRQVQSCQREEWHELLRIRKTCTDVSVTSRRLLQSQGLLMHFVPHPELRTHAPHPHGVGFSTAVPAGPSVGTKQSVAPSLSKGLGNCIPALL